jgi:hypothetical protein
MVSGFARGVDGKSVSRQSAILHLHLRACNSERSEHLGDHERLEYRYT